MQNRERPLSGRALSPLLLALALGCESSSPILVTRAPVSNEPESTVASVSYDAPRPSARSTPQTLPAGALPRVATDGPITLPPSWVACSTDAECVIVAIGCCSKVASKRVLADATRAAIQASGRRECPVKAACGAGPSGNDDGEPAVCRSGACALPK